MKRNIFLILALCFFWVSHILLSSAGIPPKSTTSDTSNPTFYNNSTSNALLSPQGVSYINKQYPGVIKPDGSISDTDLKKIQSDLWLSDTDGKLWKNTAAALEAKALASSSTAPSGNWGSSDSSSSSDGSATVIVTEEIPWANCTCIAQTTGNNPSASVTSCGDPKTRKYSCTVGKWLSGFQDIFREITRWVVYITMLLWVIAIAGAGIMWAWGSDSEEYTKKAKWWVMNILIGLVILFTFRYILWFLAPWIFQ